MKNTPFPHNFSRPALQLALAASIAGGASILNITPAQAQVGVSYCTNCATLIGQTRDLVYQARQLAEQAKIQMSTAKIYADAVRQAARLNGRKFHDITNDLRKIINAYNNTRAIGRNASNVDAAFKAQYKNYDEYLKSVGMATDTMPKRYEQWSAAGLDNARTAMEAAGINVSSFDNESNMLNAILNRSSTAKGRMQAIQASNEIAAQNVQQLQKLRDILAIQLQMQSNALAQQTERMALDDATRERMRSAKVNNSTAKDF